jgi:integrase
VHALIDAAIHIDPMFGLYVRLVAATGMRRSEACGLQWSDVDLQAERLTVARSHISLPGASGDRPTKTRSARAI